jgi:diguanylate cyclase (GGDEF)-like protein
MDATGRASEPENSNRRQEERLAARVRARMETRDGDDLPVEILDFCKAGLFLRLSASKSPKSALATGDDLRITFTSRRGQAKKYTLDGRVAHASKQGIGVYVARMPNVTFVALKQLAVDVGAGGNRDVKPMGDRVEVMRSCHDMLWQALPGMMEDFFQRIVKAMLQAQQEAYFMEQPRFQHAGETLRTHRRMIESTMQEEVRGCLLGIEKGQGCHSEDDPEADGELSLVEDAVFEDWLALTGVVNHVETGLQDELSALQYNYGALFGATVSRKGNPFGPEMLARQFGSALRPLDLEADVRQVAYRVFGDSLRARLPMLYRSLDRVLAPLAAQVPRRIVHKAEPAIGVPSAPASEAPVAPPAPPVTIENAPEPPTIPDIDALLRKLIGDYMAGHAGVGIAQPGTDAMAYTLKSILATLGRDAGGLPGVATPGAPADDGAMAPLPIPSLQSGLIQVAHQLSRALGELGAETVAQPGARALKTAPAEPDRRELIQYLDSLPAPKPQDEAALTRRLLDHIESRARTAAVDTQRTTLDIMARLLDKLGTEHPRASQLEAMFKVLEKPLLRVALADPGFLADAAHPAKRLISLLDQYAIATDDQGRFFDQGLHQFLGAVLDRVVTRADKDPTIFAKAGVYLERLVRPVKDARKRRVALLQETCEAKERVRAARARTRQMLAEMLGGRDIPLILSQLIEIGWRQYLTLLELRRGVGDAEWQRGKEAIGQLLDWLVGPDKAPSGQIVSDTLAYLEDRLATVNTEPDQIGAFIESLGEQLRDRARTDRPDAPRTARVRFAFNAHEAERPDDGLPDELVIGRWWQMQRQGNVQPVQLIWTSQPAGQCAFTNRSATEKIELALNEVAESLQNGALLPADDKDQPLFERSAQVIVDDVYQHLTHDVSHDPTTGLINRNGFVQRLRQLSARREDMSHYVCIIEFDQVRFIYTNSGLAAGETLSRALAAEITSLIGAQDMLSVFQDDIYALLVTQHNRIQILEFARKLLKRFQNFRFDHGQERYNIGINIGLAECDPMQASPEEVLKRASAACQLAKKAGRNRVQRYDPSNEQLRLQQNIMNWAGRIDQIIQEQGLYLRCQRVEPLSEQSGLRAYHEILLGVRAEGQEIEPARFLSAVERWQRGPDIDVWVVKTTFAWIAAHAELYARGGGFAINLMPASLTHPEFLKFLHAQLDEASFPLDKITFEITETSAIDNQRAAQEFMRQIRRYGCKFSLDDLGSGFSSFAHLRNLRTDSIKIDGVFVRDCHNTPSDYAMVKSMNDIGHALGLKTVAEYAETPEVLEKLRVLGVDYAQGNAVHAAMPLDQLAEERVTEAEPAIEASQPEVPEIADTVEAAPSAPEIPEPPAAELPPLRPGPSDTGMSPPPSVKPYTWRNPRSGGFREP